MRTQRLAAWPPIPAAQIPSFPTLLRDGWRMKELPYFHGLETRPLGQDRRYWPIDDPVRSPAGDPIAMPQAVREEMQRFLNHVRSIPPRPLQRKAVEEACAADGFYVGVGR